MLDGLVRRHVEKHGGEAAARRGGHGRPPTPGDPRGRSGEHRSADDRHRRRRLAAAGIRRRRASAWASRPRREGGSVCIRHHARGGIGMVFVALDSELHREVALKQIQPQHADDPDSRARFLIEAEVTGRLEHPGIVPVYGLGTNDQGRPFYAMRFVRGQSLKEAIDSFHQADSRGPAATRPSARLALRQLLRRFIDVCNAIAYAHSRGVIHRDLKPANILLGPYGETLVVDWGLAKVVGRDDPTPRPTARSTLRPGVAFRQQRDAGGHGDRHAGVHEPRAGRGAAGTDRAGQRHLQPGGDPVCLRDRPAPAGRRRPRRAAPARLRQGEIDAAAAGQPARAGGAGGDRLEGDGPAAGRSISARPVPWPKRSSAGWPTSRCSAWREPALGAGAAMDAAAADPRGRDRRGRAGGDGRTGRGPGRSDPCQCRAQAGESRAGAGQPADQRRQPRPPARQRAGAGSLRLGARRRSRHSTAGSARTCCSRRGSSTACGPSCSAARPTFISGWKTCSRAKPIGARARRSGRRTTKSAS